MLTVPGPLSRNSVLMLWLLVSIYSKVVAAWAQHPHRPSNATTEGLFMTALGFCADTEFAEAQRGCIDEITTRTDYTLENVFTYVVKYD
jgi:hypothetical protein